MHCNYRQVKYFALAISVAAAMSGIALAQNASDPDRSNPSANHNYSYTNNSNSMVSQAQQELKHKGFYTDKVDGINGAKTRMAIRRYQQANDLKPSGHLDQATLSSLGLKSTENGGSGEASRSAEQSSNNEKYATGENSSGKISPDKVRDAQQKLAEDGYYNGKVDGMMNEGTRSAIRQYQKDNNLRATGQLNRETAKSMGSTHHRAILKTITARPR